MAISPSPNVTGPLASVVFRNRLPSESDSDSSLWNPASLSVTVHTGTVTATSWPGTAGVNLNYKVQAWAVDSPVLARVNDPIAPALSTARHTPGPGPPS